MPIFDSFLTLRSVLRIAVRVNKGSLIGNCASVTISSYFSVMHNISGVISRLIKDISSVVVLQCELTIDRDRIAFV